MIKSNGITLNNEDYAFIPPAPSGEDRGGITESEYNNYNAALEDVSQLKEDLGDLSKRVSSTNLFDKDKAIYGHYYNNNGIYADGNVYTSEFIPCEPDTPYTVFPSQFWFCFFDKNKKFISSTPQGVGTVTSPVGSAYLTVITLRSKLDITQVNVGEALLPYETFYDYVITNVKNSYTLVDKNGYGDYKTVTEAVRNAQDGETIVVNNGVYDNEEVEAWGKEVHIVGINKNTCIIKNHTGDYFRPPIEIGRGSLENLSIITEYDENSTASNHVEYCVHVEDNNLSDGNLRISNCVMCSNYGEVIGIGLRKNCNVVIENCELTNLKTRGALFFHDSDIDAYVGSGQNITVKNCTLESDCDTVSTIRINSRNKDGAECSCKFINNVIYNKKNWNCTLYYGNSTIVKSWDELPNLSLHPASSGNNLPILNA